MALTLTHCFVTVRDQDEALGFYRDVLGLEVKADIEIGSMRWLTVGSADPGNPVEISLETPTGRPGEPGALEKVMSEGSLTAANFRSEDCDAHFARAVEAGAPVIQEPKDQPYGVRDCAVRDPSGNMVRFSTPL